MVCIDRLQHPIHTELSDLLIEIFSRTKVYVLVTSSTVFDPSCLMHSYMHKLWNCFQHFQLWKSRKCRLSLVGSNVWSMSPHTRINIFHASIRITTANSRVLFPLAASVMTPSNQSCFICDNEISYQRMHQHLHYLVALNTDYPYESIVYMQVSVLKQKLLAKILWLAIGQIR